MTNRPIALIDGDIVKYRCGFSCESRQWNVYAIGEEEYGPVESFKYKREALAFVDNREGFVLSQSVQVEPVENALHNTKSFIEGVFKNNRANEGVVFVSKGKTFRDEVYPEYKANRIDSPKPKHFAAIEEYLDKYHNVRWCEGIEADDAISAESWFLYTTASDPHKKPKSVVCTADKDLDQIPGWHYSFTDESHYYVTENDATRWLWSQILTGDATDNIPGIKGLGKKGAYKLIEELTSPIDIYNKIINQVIKNKWGTFKVTNEYINFVGKLVYLLRDYDDSWEAYCEREKIPVKGK